MPEEIEVPSTTCTRRFTSGRGWPPSPRRRVQHAGCAQHGHSGRRGGRRRLFAGHAANEAVLEQIRASDEWNHYSPKASKTTSSTRSWRCWWPSAKTIEGKDAQKLAEYKNDMEEIKKEAEAKEADSAKHMQRHVILSRGVTLFQIAIALSAIAVLTKKRPLWLSGLALGAIGAFFFIRGLL